MKYTKLQIIETYTEGINNVSKFMTWLDDNADELNKIELR